MNNTSILNLDTIHAKRCRQDNQEKYFYHKEIFDYPIALARVLKYVKKLAINFQSYEGVIESTFI